MGAEFAPKLSGTITGLLKRMRSGEDDARDELFRTVYAELRDIARHQLAKQARRQQPLEGTELINAACERLLGKCQLDAENRRHFFYLFGRAMHDVLVEEARRASTYEHMNQRLHGPRFQVIVDGEKTFSESEELRVALNSLRAMDAGAAQVVDMRCFAGRTIEQTAEILNRTTASVRRDWTYAKAWLKNHLAER